ncbi:MULTISPECIES: hypothetical protein [Nocardia]|uniref:hypothetical protein n=1 Tax=Nocardia TaxID=1817 RepID=UPI0006CFFCEE|nr:MULTISPECIES: hypothetical protein [Nocardia]
MHRFPNRVRRVLRALRDAVSVPHSHPGEVRVRVYLNRDRNALLTGYEPDAPLTLAYTYLLRADPATDTDEVLLERVFAAFNDHPEHDEDQIHTDTWYAKGMHGVTGLRSLSVGDLVGLDDRHYACESTGWSPVPAPTL